MEVPTRGSVLDTTIQADWANLTTVSQSTAVRFVRSEVIVYAWRRLTGVALVVASLAVSSAPAVAAGRSAKRAPAHSTPAATYRADMATIDAEFSLAVAHATAALQRAMAHAATAAERINARNVYRLAIRRATQRREIEVEVLDSSPIGVQSGDGSSNNADGSSNADH